VSDAASRFAGRAQFIDVAVHSPKYLFPLEEFTENRILHLEKYNQNSMLRELIHFEPNIP
jgi:hypothetical protein